MSADAIIGLGTMTHDEKVGERAEQISIEREARARADEQAARSFDLTAAATRMVTGGGYVLDVPDHAAAIWGDDERVAWAEGESCMIYSPPGTGKTTLAGLLLRGRLGLESAVLGMPMHAGHRRVLYLAMDRPQQIARALRRQFSAEDRAVLDERLTVWRGPLPADLGSHPTLLLDLARAADADTIVVDSLKDAAARLAEDEGGRQYNLARQHAIAEGVELLELHHARKATADGRKGLSLDDVYGSTWITSGAGSVIAIIGEPGDTSVEIRGVKTARGDVGPMRVTVDREAGTMFADTVPSVVDVLRGQGALLAKVISQLVHGRDSVSNAEVARTRRELEKLSTAGVVERMPITATGGGVDRIAYRLAEPLEGL
ncbi:AAA family ATPase [Microbacterium sp. NEAU-LLC]|uniref:AAA family ATPase n=1 Tax=Microbacterium helvum TaxID=2773713 RepID=A0ABR8NLZ1_9MICO|nr:AAA family ATPase [Microbacterium helvum]MBD3941689.1 AAA family ATPase [Microbacterium helvum]